MLGERFLMQRPLDTEYAPFFPRHHLNVLRELYGVS